jgi:hypothetical protein
MIEPEIYSVEVAHFSGGEETFERSHPARNVVRCSGFDLVRNIKISFKCSGRAERRLFFGNNPCIISRIFAEATLLTGTDLLTHRAPD